MGHESPYACVQPLDWAEVRWTRGFWAERFQVCAQRTVPHLWSVMGETRATHYLQNFRIAAGLAEGSHRGAPFNDGDFYKWLEAASAVVSITQEPQWEHRLQEVIAIIGQAQHPDGYLHTPVLIRQRQGDPQAIPFRDPLDFEMYNMGHLFTAACVRSRTTGKDDLLAIAVKAADFLDRFFRQPTPELARHSVCPSHYMGLVELYRTTGQGRYLELAQRLFAMRDWVVEGSDENQDRLPFCQQREAVGHAVRANYLYAGAADLFLETGLPDLWRTLEHLWANVAGKKMYITGGCGALYDGASPDGAEEQRVIRRVHQAYGRNYQLPNITAHCETCANIGNVLWNWRMFLATGEARFMDVLELALYNSVLSGMSLDGTRFLYVNPLRVVEPLPTPLRWPRFRVPYLSSFCCPPNLARLLAQLHVYAYSKSYDALWVNLYSGSIVTTTLPHGATVRLLQETNYPWDGCIRLVVEECPRVPFGLNLRIPRWAKEATVSCNGQPVLPPPQPGTYFELRRLWQPGEQVEVRLPMPPRWMEAHPLVEETLNQVALQRGPLVYCLESVDLPSNTPLMEVRIPSTLIPQARYEESLLGGVVALEGEVLVREPKEWGECLYRELPPPSFRRIVVRFIPYFAWGNRGPTEMTVWLPWLA